MHKLLFLISHFLVTSSTSEKIIKTSNGPVIGHRLKGFSRPIIEYLGIPFAQPPVGSLRFQPPKEIKKPIWKKAYHANKKAKTCMQPIIVTNFSLLDLLNPDPKDLSEDCLQFNMWVPKNKKDSVIVYFYGGSFLTGSASRYAYNGSALADKSRSIVITINYRLGFLGFAYLKNSSSIPGNMGLLDQQMALKWIHKNIKKFGGNPKKVTIFGQSAGSVSATAHLFVDDSKNLFTRIIASSGVISHAWATVDQSIADENTKLVAKMIQCPVDDRKKMEECIIKAPYSKLLGASISIKNPRQPPLPSLFVPVESDDNFFKGSFKTKYKQGKAHKNVRLVIGRNKDEATYFMYKLLGEKYGCKFDHTIGSKHPENQCNVNEKVFLFVASLIGKMIGLEGPTLLPLINLYNNSNLENYRDKTARLLADMMFDCDISAFAEYYSSYINKNVYFYEFNKRSVLNKFPEWMGVMHKEDLDPSFGIPFLLPKWYKNSKQHYFEKVFSTNIMMYFGRFSNDGYPSKSWKKYVPKKGLGLIIDRNLVIKGKKKVHVSTYKSTCFKIMEMMFKVKQKNP